MKEEQGGIVQLTAFLVGDEEYVVDIMRVADPGSQEVLPGDEPDRHDADASMCPGSRPALAVGDHGVDGHQP